MTAQVLDVSGLSADLVVGVVGVVLGLVLGLGADALRNHRTELHRDRRLLQALIDRLAGKRALNSDRERGGDFDEADAKRCTDSILDARQRILHVCESLSVRDAAMPALRNMGADCLAYLNFIERQPETYVTALIGLSGRLHASGQALGNVVRGLRVEQPGSRDLTPPDWLLDA